MTVAELRARAMAVLAGALALEAEEIRRAHNLACLFGDAEAIALWARVVWRGVAGDGRYAWLREPLGVPTRIERSQAAGHRGGVATRERGTGGRKRSHLHA